MMKQMKTTIQGIPANLWGDASESLFLYIHGMGGNKGEGESFAEIVCPRGWQVLSIDLPEHGERHGETERFYPWYAVPELRAVMDYARANWKHISLRATSIGAWFSMLSFAQEEIDECLFVSPVLDMKRLISNMMHYENVTEEQLKREQVIPVASGQPLSWKYWEYVCTHPIESWNVPTSILYGAHDILVQRDTVNQFVTKHKCKLTVEEDCEHWFHTKPQLEALERWEKENTQQGAAPSELA